MPNENANLMPLQRIFHWFIMDHIHYHILKEKYVNRITQTDSLGPTSLM
jgi:hypothetical protein